MYPGFINLTTKADGLTLMISDAQRQTFSTVIYVFVCGILSIFGVVANVINMIVFYKQGLNTTINISFFALAISDLCCLLLQQYFNLYVNPLFQDSGIPMVYLDVQYITSGVPREVFARITCLITAYITTERCLCVTFPLHVKQMITPKLTTSIIILLYILTFLSVAPYYTTCKIDWKFFADQNRSLLGLKVSNTHENVEGVVYLIHSIAVLVSFLTVILLTCVLIHKLGLKSDWRKTFNGSTGKGDSVSNKDRKTISMVVAIACILIICYIPAVLLCAATFLEPEFATGGKYYNLYYILWSFAVLTETVNSSVNIFMYFKMSTKYRQAFLELFTRCGDSKKNDVIKASVSATSS